MSFLRRSTFTRLSLSLGIFGVVSSLALAQRQVVPPHPPAAPVHVSPPPVYHPPVMQAPPVRPPVIYAPRYMPPRNGVIPYAGGLGTRIVLPPVHPIRPIRPIFPVIFIYSPRFILGEPFWALNSCWFSTCDLFWPWITGYTSFSSPGPVTYVPQVYESPGYVYGGEREDFPQLFLKDGTVLNVMDYWVVDGQLHFKLVQAIGQKAVEQSVPFEELDLQQTIDANTARGFRFVLRNEPFEQYVRDHPEGPPPALTPQPK